MRRLLALAAVLAAVLAAAGAVAQPVAPPASPTPFLDVGGQIRMDRLVIHTAGTVQIRLLGADPVREETRTNLPPRVGEGQAYRDARYRFRLAVSPLLQGLLPADSLLLPPPRRRPSPDSR